MSTKVAVGFLALVGAVLLWAAFSLFVAPLFHHGGCFDPASGTTIACGDPSPGDGPVPR